MFNILTIWRQNDINDVALKKFTNFSSVPIVDSEQVNVSWAHIQVKKVTSKIEFVCKQSKSWKV